MNKKQDIFNVYGNTIVQIYYERSGIVIVSIQRYFSEKKRKVLKYKVFDSKPDAFMNTNETILFT